MSNGKKTFKTQVWGFDRSDVMDYIESLAIERNKYMALSGDSEARIQELEDEVARLRKDMEGLSNELKSFKLTEVGDARGAIDELERVYDDVRSDMDVTSTHISGELHRLGDTMSLLSQTLSKTGARFGELRGALDQKKQQIESEGERV